jgi:hypothetical protein
MEGQSDREMPVLPMVGSFVPLLDIGAVLAPRP